jgi:outer membrane receptor protein involved in Fe transport
VTAGPPFVDVDYKGDQDISAWYFMVDLPLTSFLNVIAGVRFERTKISIINDPEEDATWLPPGASGPVTLNPGDADVTFEQHDALPSIGFVLTPFEQLTLRGSYTETVARQTFKELSPIRQQDFLGGDVFIGNPELQMSALKNYDLRLDYTPYPGSLISGSWFYKDIKRPIEFVQQNAGFTFTRPVNYPEGKLRGFEFEIRQDLGHFWTELAGLSMQANATIIDSEVTLPDDEIEKFASPALMVPMTTRDMVNAPEYLYNIGLTGWKFVGGCWAVVLLPSRVETPVARGPLSQNRTCGPHIRIFGIPTFSGRPSVARHCRFAGSVVRVVRHRW